MENLPMPYRTAASGICFSAIGNAPKMRTFFERAYASLKLVENPEQRLSLAVAMLEASDLRQPPSTDLFRDVVSDMYKTKDENLQERAETAAIRFLCENAEFARALSMANRTNRPDTIINRYILILNAIIRRNFGDQMAQKWDSVLAI